MTRANASVYNNFRLCVFLHKMRKLCLLCLKITDSKKCAESKLFIELLDVLLLNPWWNISKTPTLCHTCSMKIAKAFGFKANCVYTEDLLAPHIKSENSCRIDLRATYLKMKKCEIQTRSAGEFLKICSLCINLINSSCTFIMDLLRENNFEEKFKKYIPELNLCNIEDPLICQQCNDSLRDFIEFVTSCINTNDKVKKYRLTNDIDDDEEIDLRKVLDGDLIPNQKDSNKNIYDNNILKDTIKTESVDVECRSSSVLFLGEHSGVKSEDIEIESDHLTSDIEYRRDESSKNTNKQKYTKRKANEKLENKTTLGKKVNARKSNGKPFKCKDCDFETTTIDKLKMHERRKHRDLHNAKKFSCDECDFQTTERYRLTRHSLKHKDHSEIKIYHCNKCTFESRYKAVIKGHYITHLSKDEVKLYYCDNCGYSAKLKSRLNQHKKIHEDMSKIKTFKCNIGSCTYQTIENSYLKKHILRHNKKRPEMETLYCFNCDFRTKYKKHLRNHVLIHNGRVTIHYCKLCKFKTKWKPNFQTHMRKKHV